MRIVTASAKAFWRDQSGATSIEYAIIATGIAVVIVAGLTSIGAKLNIKFTNVLTGFS